MSKELFVGPFPCFVTRKEKEQFLLYFGAVNVTHVSRKNKEIYVIAIFNAHKDCEYALKKIHQIEIFGIRISAKYYDSVKQHIPSCTKISNFRSSLVADDSTDVSSQLKIALLNYEAELSSISLNFDVRNPIPPKLRYSYPPPTPSVLCNIAHALVAVPKFYTQVLHLMNKMNLPCPFGPLTGEPSLCKEAKTMTSVFSNTEQENRAKGKENYGRERDSFVEAETFEQHLESDSESELESDEELKSIFNKEKHEPKRTFKRKPKKINKRPKLETLKQSLLGTKENLIKEPKDNMASLQKVFEMPNLNPKKKMNVKVQNATVFGSDTTSKEESVSEGFGKLYPQLKQKKLDEPKESAQFISMEDLSNNRIQESDWPIVPVFKNYNAGTPSVRLYIKNLAKTVTENDLRFIFGRYLTKATENDASKFSIRLMKEGRMKGQAFVTLASVETASVALRDVNGYILKDKPMVIVFGKTKTND